jgi:hypothetical protein
LESQLITDVFKILEGAFAKKEPVLLHELLWSIDAKHHLILNPEEINSAVDLIGGIRKRTDGNEVELNQLKAKKSEYISDEDIDRAMKIYNENLKG